MQADNPITIIPFSDESSQAIKTLNIEWLERYFKIEPKDDLILSNPKKYILEPGGFIFYAKYKDAIVGTVSLIKMNETTFELSKMAVTDSVQGLGVGKKLLAHCLSVVEEQKIQKLILYSNRRLTPALHLYEKFGFVEVPLEGGAYERADIKMERVTDIE